MALRRMVKTALAAGLRWTGANSVIETLNATKHIPLVIGYHSVVEDIRMHQGRAILPNLVSLRMLERPDVPAAARRPSDHAGLGAGRRGGARGRRGRRAPHAHRARAGRRAAGRDPGSAG